MLAAVVVGLVTVVTLGYFAIRAWLVLPIRTLEGTMTVLAGGDLSADVDGGDRKDEVGGMARAVQVFKDEGLRARTLSRDADAAREAREADRLRTAEADRIRAEAMAVVTGGLVSGLTRLSAGDLTVELRPLPSMPARGSCRAAPTICRSAPSSRRPRWRRPQLRSTRSPSTSPIPPTARKRPAPWRSGRMTAHASPRPW